MKSTETDGRYKSLLVEKLGFRRIDNKNQLYRYGDYTFFFDFSATNPSPEDIFKTAMFQLLEQRDYDIAYLTPKKEGE